MRDPRNSNAHSAPRELGGYRILDCLGQGSYATVYRAQRQGLPGNVALKVLPSHVQGEALARFKREARLASRLEHPGIVRCFDVGQDPGSGTHYLGLEYIDGTSLEDRLRAGGALPWRQALEIMIPVADAVAYAHGQEVIHRDLKPANVLIDAHGHPRVTDFGLARDSASPTLTTAGEVLGTPFYMAPEQVRGDQASALFDVHALGAMLYELLTSSPPYPGGSVAEVTRRILQGNPPAPSTLSPYPVPAALDAIVLEALATDPARRTQSAAGLALSLRQLLLVGETPIAPARSPRSMLGFALGAGGGLALGLIALIVLSPLAGTGPSRPLTAPDAPLPGAVLDPPPPTSDPQDPQQPTASPADSGDRVAFDAALDEARAKVRAWDWEGADAELEKARSFARGELAHGELRKARRMLSDERELERATLGDLDARYLRQFDAWTALDEVEQELAAHPRSARLAKLALKLNGVCGDYARVRELGEGARERTPAEERILALCAGNAAGPPPAPRSSPLWERWAPLWGGVWTERASGELFGRGCGLGEFEFAGLARKEPSVSAPYRLEVELQLDYARDQSYAGVLFAARDAENMLLAYVFHHDEVLAQLSPQELEIVRRESKGKPKFVRVASLTNGSWVHLDTRLCVFPDEGWTTLAVITDSRSVEVEVAGRTAAKVQLRQGVEPGRVGVMKWYDTDATFRNLRVSAIR